LLVYAPESEASPIGFRTSVAEPRSAPPPPNARDFEVRIIGKAPENPYPDRISVGRAPNRDVVLRDATVSKLHAYFLVRPGGGFELLDLGAPNGTYLNGLSLPPNEARPVAVGDVVQFGRVECDVVDAGLLHDAYRRKLSGLG
jgi:hypothetical protein